jgi:hypothetical protein
MQRIRRPHPTPLGMNRPVQWDDVLGQRAMDRPNKRYFVLAAPRRASSGVLQRSPLAAPLIWAVPERPAPHGCTFGGAPAQGLERCSVPRAWTHDAERGSGGPPGGFGRKTLGKASWEMLGVSWGNGFQTGLHPLIAKARAHASNMLSRPLPTGNALLD